MASLEEWIEFEVVDRLSMKKRKLVGAFTESWGMTIFTGNGWDKTQLNGTQMVRLLRKFDAYNKTVQKNRRWEVSLKDLRDKLGQKPKKCLVRSGVFPWSSSVNREPFK